MSIDEKWVRDLWHQLGGREKVNGYEFARLVAEAEREACAKVCCEIKNTDGSNALAWECAAAIRARGQQ